MIQVYLACRTLKRSAGVFDEMHIAVVAARVDASVGDRVEYGAVHFVNVSAIGKSTVTDVRSNVSEQTANLGRGNVPQLQLPNARRVDQIAASGQWDQLRRGGGVLTFHVLLTNALHAQG